jgi:hypothetical protein
MAEGALVQRLSVLPSASRPPGDGGLSVAEDSFSGGDIQSFGQRRQHNGDLLGRGFQTIQRGMAVCAERGAAGLAAKGLDALGMAMLAITNESMHVCVWYAEVGALLVGAGEVLGVYAFGCSSPAFDLAPGEKVEERQQDG